MRKDFIPRGNPEFRTYIVHCHKKIVEKATDYGIPATAIAPITLLLDAYITVDDRVSTPETATKPVRDERKEARMALEKAWRVFINIWIRFNNAIGTAEKEAFRVMPRDTMRTPAKRPIAKGLLAVHQLGTGLYEIRVVNAATGKRRLPEDAAGSYLYLLVSEPGVVPEDVNEYRRQKFSSKSLHTLQLPASQMRRQANVFVRYANRHGEEGPAGAIIWFIIT
jgi:hypothetical protein